MKKDARSTDMGDRPARAGAVANAAQILFLNRWYYPEVFGGTETSLRDLARTLLDMGVQVSVVCETRSLPTGWQNVEGVRVYRHGGPPPPRSHWSLRSLDMYGHNIAWLRRLRPELEGLPIVARTYWYAAAARAALPRARLIYWVPGTGRLFEPIEQSGLKGRAQAWAAFETAQARWIERRALRGANLILVESAHVRRDLVEHYRVNPHKVRQTWIGVDSARFQPRPPDHALLGELGLPPQAPVILCVARLAPMKNHPFLLRAFAQLTNRRAVLIFLGDGPDREALQSLAASLQIGDRVYFPGFRDDVERFFSVASVFVLASHYEPYGVVFSEALASGVPALALMTSSAGS